MAVSTKIISKLAMQIQSGASYESNAMFLVPVTRGKLKQTFSKINDESYNGEAFTDLPQKGVQDIEGTISFQVEKITFAKILEAAFGTVNTLVYTLGSNTKKLSVVFYDGVKTYKYANVYIKSLKISGSTDQKIMGEMTLIGATAEVRDDTAFPSYTAHSEYFTFHEVTCRIGDQADALAVGDDRTIEEFSIDIMCGFGTQHANTPRTILTPIFGMERPSVTGSVKIARHDADTFLAWRDAFTKLQMSLDIYKSATSRVVLQVPNFIIDCDLSDDDITSNSLSLSIGRNGIGTSYTNTNISYVSPVIATVTQS
jgi:hypothetical protein